MNVRHRLLPWFALAGALLPVWMLGGSLLVGLSRPGYEPLRDAISELGERGASTGSLWNIGGFGVVALLYAVYALAIRAGFGIGWLSGLTAMQAVFIAAGAGFECDPGCPPVPVTETMTRHIVVGLAYVAITTVVPVVARRAFPRTLMRSHGSGPGVPESGGHDPRRHRCHVQLDHHGRESGQSRGRSLSADPHSLAV